MKKFYLIFNFFIFCFQYYQILSLQRKNITFKYSDIPPFLRFTQSDTYIVTAKFSRGEFLYIYPFFENSNTGIYKIFFKKYKDNDEEANIFNSDFYTLEVNSGLFIDSNKLDYDVANIFIYI